MSPLCVGWQWLLHIDSDELFHTTAPSVKPHFRQLTEQGVYQVRAGRMLKTPLIRLISFDALCGALIPSSVEAQLRIRDAAVSSAGRGAFFFFLPTPLERRSPASDMRCSRVLGGPWRKGGARQTKSTARFEWLLLLFRSSTR